MLIGLSAAGAVAQEAATSGPNKLSVAPGSSTYINVSSRMMNEVVVPYANPQLIKYLKASSKASVQMEGNSIFVSTADEEFIQLIIKNEDAPTAPGFSLTLLPVEDIPGQHIVLTTKSDSAAADKDADRGAALAVNDYEDILRELIRDAARDVVPRGYIADGGWNGAEIRVGPIYGKGTRRLIGSHLAIEYFTLTNTGAAQVELIEPNFKQPGVRAIAFTDAILLSPGQQTRLVWVRNR